MVLKSYFFIPAMAPRKLQKHPRLQDAAMRRQRPRGGPRGVTSLPHSSRLDRLYILHHRLRSTHPSPSYKQGFL